MNSATKRKRTILFLAANPKNSTQLRLDQEIKEIDSGLQLSKKRDKFQLETVLAATPRDLQRAMQRYKPQIVHFSGHGIGEEGLVLEDVTGQAKLVRGEGLARMFKGYVDRFQIECVVLNACYSKVQADAISQFVPYVVGMSQAIGDSAAREFAVGFYDSLGAGESIETAYEDGCISISLYEFPEHLTPILKKQNGLPPLEITNLLKSSELVPNGSSQLLPTSQVQVVASEELRGQVPLDSPLYIDRPPIETQCYETIVKPGALIRIKAPRQMGKSSLMLRILNHAKEQGYQAASLDLQSAGGQMLSSLDQFLHWFCSRITRKLKLSDKLDEYWQGALGSNDKCTDYFELYLLPKIDSPLALCLDEIDELFKHPAVASDFFGLLRAWHEESKSNSNSVWRNLRLVITYSKEVYIPLDINRSPFNVGMPIDLPQLNQLQVLDLVTRHGLSWSEIEVDQLMAMVGGHPFLLRVALYHIALGQITLEKFLQIAPTEEWEYEGHLRHHLLLLEEDTALVDAMKKVVVSNGSVRLRAIEAYKLACMGLVRFQGNNVIPRCDLYRRYFKDRLGVGE